MLLGLLAVGIYLLYRSLQNVSGSVANVQGQVSGLLTGLESIPGTAYSTLKSEGSATLSSLLSPIAGMASLGTSASNLWNQTFSGFGGTSSLPSSLTDLTPITAPSLIMPDGSVGTLTSDLGSGVLLPDGGSLDLHLGGGLTAINSDGSWGDNPLTDLSPGDLSGGEEDSFFNSDFGDLF